MIQTDCNCYYTQKLLRWIIERNVKAKTINFLEVNIGEYIPELWKSKVFLESNNLKNYFHDKLDFIKTKNIDLLIKRYHKENE